MCICANLLRKTVQWSQIETRSTIRIFTLLLSRIKLRKTIRIDQIYRSHLFLLNFIFLYLFLCIYSVINRQDIIATIVLLHIDSYCWVYSCDSSRNANVRSVKTVWNISLYTKYCNRLSGGHKNNDININ